MRAFRRVTRRVAGLFSGARADRDFDAEVRSHLQLHIDDNLRAGMTEGEARRVALARFGPAAAIAERHREQRTVPLLDQSVQDVRYALRLMRKSPGFSAVAVLSLALGIGVNALAFSIVHAVVLEPLPIANAHEVLFVERDSGFTMSFPAYRDLRDRNTTFAGLAGYRISPMDLEVANVPARIWGYLATGNYFEVLGVHPLAGRFFDPGDDRPGAAPVAVLSDEAWQRWFARDPRAVGAIVRINRQPFTIVGVAAPGFRGTEVFYRPELWVPMVQQAEIEIGNAWLDNRATANTMVIGRLRPGVTADAAGTNLTAIGATLAGEYPRTDVSRRYSMARPGLVGSALRTPVTAFTAGVLALAGIVLLIASVNLAAALTARGTDRQRELSLRLAIGAGAGRIIRQILIETLVLVTFGGVGGAVLAWVGSRALSVLSLPVEVPINFDVQADRMVFAFACAVSLATALVAGLVPARQAARTDPNAALKGHGPLGTARLRFAARDVMVVVQVTLCVILISACLLSLRGLNDALTMDLGMKPSGVAMVGFELGLARYAPETQPAFQRRALEAVKVLPGITVAAYASALPLSIDVSSTSIFPESRPTLERRDAPQATRYRASPDFFRTIGTRIIEGRDFEWRDDAHAPRVAIVNATFARTILRTESGVGQRFAYGPGGPLIEVIGVVEDGKYVTLSEPPRAVVFDNILQSPSTNVVLLARSAGPESETVALLSRTIRQLDPQLTLFQAQSVRDMLALVLFPSRAAAVALSTFGLLAALLAGTGIYGVVAYAVARRVREIGVRIAIGARPGQVLRLVFLRVGILMLAGAACGLAIAAAASRLLTSIVYQASAADPLVFTGVILSVVLLGLAASWAPARRALRLNPTTALRAE
jgi:predicted permease